MATHCSHDSNIFLSVVSLVSLVHNLSIESSIIYCESCRWMIPDKLNKNETLEQVVTSVITFKQIKLISYSHKRYSIYEINRIKQLKEYYKEQINKKKMFSQYKKQQG